MNKTELIAAVAEKANLSKKDADSAVNAVIDSIVEAVAANDKVQLVGFGTFEVRERNERKGRDPRTNKEIVIQGCCEIISDSFSAGFFMKPAFPVFKTAAMPSSLFFCFVPGR